MNDVMENNTKLVNVPVQLLEKIFEYIENSEEIIDGEWGGCRSVTQLIEDGEMPDLYNKLKGLINNK